MQIKRVIGKPIMVMIALALVTMADAVMNTHLRTTEQGSNIVYASAPLEADQGPFPPRALKENVGTNRQLTVGIVRWIQCREDCYLTLSSQKTGQIITLKGSLGLTPEKGNLKKPYQGARVKATWHTEKTFHPVSRVYETENVIDQMEILP